MSDNQDINATTPSRRVSFRRLLFAGLSGIGLLLVILLALSNQAIQEASHHLLETQTQIVSPLVEVNNLQTRINRIRTIEIELSRMADYFAVTTQLELLRSESSLFAKQLDEFLVDLHVHSPVDTQRLDLYWQGYRDELLAIMGVAEKMNLEQAVQISTYQSAPRFTNIARTLQRIARSTEQRALENYQNAVSGQQLLHRLFLAISIIGFTLLAMYIIFIARSLSQRLSRLAEAVRSITAGQVKHPIELQGNDELTELAIGFNAMQEQVLLREGALRTARAELEHRVLARTGQLKESNEKLIAEVEERKRAEQTLRLLSQAVEQSPVSVMITDIQGRIEYVNDTFVSITGYAREEAIGNTPALLKSGQTSAETYRSLWSTISQGGDWEGELHNQKRDGTLYWEHARISPVKDRSGHITHYLSVQEDITLRREQEDKIVYQAQYDSLTGLPNRVLALDRLSQIIRTAVREKQMVALMFIDLDDFKKINDSLGHHIGDELLIQASQRLSQAVRSEDTVARYGGDEFLVIIGDLSEISDSKTIVDKILDSFAPAFTVSGYDLVVTPSIGLTIYPNDGEDPATLMRNADLAMYQAKERGRNTYQFFTQEIHDYSLRRLEMERHLHHALEHDEMRVFYQPLMETETNRMVGAEALIRWENPTIGWVTPDRFIDIAEHTGLICPIGDWILIESCRQIQKWQMQSRRELHLSVNISPRQFQAKCIVKSLEHALQQTGFPAHQLHLEVTEGLLIRNLSEAKEALSELKQMGVKLVLDDFGTGYSSLSYLRSFPFHSMKIDRSFVKDITTLADARSLITAAINMGKSLGLKVVAEGVETEEQLKLLRELGCTYAQGYLFSKPLSADDFRKQWVFPQLRSVDFK